MYPVCATKCLTRKFDRVFKPRVGRISQFQESIKVSAGELPTRKGSAISSSAHFEGEDVGCEVGEREGVGRREYLALKDGEVDLDLVEPAWHGRAGAPSVGLRCSTRLEPGSAGGLAAMRAAIVDHPEDAIGQTVGFDGHDLIDQASERLDTGRRFQPPEQLGPVDIPGGQVGPQRVYSCSTRRGRRGPAEAVGWQRRRAWREVFSLDDGVPRRGRVVRLRTCGR